jgi:hypothetical protein
VLSISVEGPASSNWYWCLRNLTQLSNYHLNHHPCCQTTTTMSLLKDTVRSSRLTRQLYSLSKAVNITHQERRLSTSPATGAAAAEVEAAQKYCLNLLAYADPAAL